MKIYIDDPGIIASVIDVEAKSWSRVLCVFRIESLGL